MDKAVIGMNFAVVYSLNGDTEQYSNVSVGGCAEIFPKPFLADSTKTPPGL